MANLFISSSCIKDGANLFAKLDVLLALNLTQVELSAPHEHLPLKKLVTALKLYVQKGMDFIIHNYFPIPPKNFVFNPASNDKEIRELSRQHLEDAFSLVNHIDSSLFAFHPGYYYDATEAVDGQFIMDPKFKVNKKVAYDNFQASLNLCKSLSKEHDAWFAVENLFPMPVGASVSETSLFCRYEEFELLRDELANNSKMGLLIDLGHLQISSKYYGFSKDIFLEKMIKNFESKIFEIHLSENNSTYDTHDAFTTCDCWQLEWVTRLNSIKSTVPGGLKFTLEARKLETEKLLFNIALINEALEG